MALDFAALFGNEDTRRRIALAVREDTLPHAFLIVGPRGSGRHTLVRETVAAINCENRTDAAGTVPCRRCNTCRRIFSGQFPDFKILKRQKDKVTIGVDEVRTFRDDMFLSATEARCKAYLFEDADAITPQAQNALLKVIEEPPTRMVVFLIAESTDRILTTIRSRTQCVRMERFENDVLEKYLLENSSEAQTVKRTRPDRFSALLLDSDGVIGAALARMTPKAAEEIDERRNVVMGFLAAIAPKAEYMTIKRALDDFPTKVRQEFCLACEDVLNMLRDLMLIKRAPDCDLLFFTDRSLAQDEADRLSQKRLGAVCDLVSRALAAAQSNGNMSLVLTRLATGIKLV